MSDALEVAIRELRHTYAEAASYVAGDNRQPEILRSYANDLSEDITTVTQLESDFKDRSKEILYLVADARRVKRVAVKVTYENFPDYVAMAHQRLSLRIHQYTAPDEMKMMVSEIDGLAGIFIGQSQAKKAVRIILKACFSPSTKPSSSGVPTPVVTTKRKINIKSLFCGTHIKFSDEENFVDDCATDLNVTKESAIKSDSSCSEQKKFSKNDNSDEYDGQTEESVLKKSGSPKRKDSNDSDESSDSAPYEESSKRSDDHESPNSKKRRQ